MGSRDLEKRDPFFFLSRWRPDRYAIPENAARTTLASLWKFRPWNAAWIGNEPRSDARSKVSKYQGRRSLLALDKLNSRPNRVQNDYFFAAYLFSLIWSTAGKWSFIPFYKRKRNQFGFLANKIEQDVTAFAIWANGSQSQCFPRVFARSRANVPPRFLNTVSVLVCISSPLLAFLLSFFIFPTQFPITWQFDKLSFFVSPT